MNLIKLLPAVALAAGCASLPGQDEEPVKDIIKDPAKIHGFFIRKIREREELIAAKVTTLRPEEQLFFGVRNTIAPDLTRRILLGLEQHKVEVAPEGRTARVQWCNPEFGISREFQMVNPSGKIWQLDITREQIEDFARAGLAWFRRQREAADGRIYAYPPDWVATKVSASCPCGNR
ncbi:MAG TPA: hypothetical protein VFS19_03085 [Planctomycetota bacterium]|nr:hypothetical protein [Planctomycetota bacterium]